MKTFVALALAGSAVAQGVTSAIAPDASAPSGCETSADGEYQVSVVNVTTSASKRGVERRQLAGTLTVTLSDGVLTDQADRTGYIAANYQWQFDDPPQTGAIYTSGFSLCSNNSFALGGSAVFYQCYTGGFYNIYDRDWADQCSPIYLVAVSSGTVTQTSDGQPGATTALTQVTQQTDGQPAAPTSGVVLTQISDGQPQAPTGVISQISDGQPQAPTGVITQISDGQPQAPTGPVVTQISDGQPQAPTSGAVITQISDGQPQAPTSFISQISDGQPQAPVATGNGTGNYSATSAAPSEFTGAAATPVYGVGAFAAGLFGLAALL
ncbi:hypothetical protein K491DRAFT_267100 [Lophiostoma macrostomum CBS 122681]|uniref:Cell wall mannoprotein PIR1-like C-terminal domain-containing protein n=1 Tax=Lophiostoma macrostomum CBS 122681 TaxID=1314788 RepID=A0A6A6TEH9_9PLEO|nr:hypothetical protein K491DRAFT_267100 [Lophiostoma macrostomum CBS 122681]